MRRCQLPGDLCAFGDLKIASVDQLLISEVQISRVNKSDFKLPEFRTVEDFNFVRLREESRRFDLKFNRALQLFKCVCKISATVSWEFQSQIICDEVRICRHR